MLAPGEVAGDQHGPAAGLLDQGGGVAGVLVLAEVGDRDVGAFAGEGEGDGTADTAVAAGDERPFPGEAAAATVAVLAVVGLPAHPRGAAGRLLLGFVVGHRVLVIVGCRGFPAYPRRSPHGGRETRPSSIAQNARRRPRILDMERRCRNAAAAGWAG
jgi:hypothetical protein